MTVLPERPVISPETRAIVALGIKAAQLPYPADKPLVIALAPGLPRESFADRSRPMVMVPMTPRAGKVAAALKRLQPELKRFTVLWTTDSADFSVSEMVSAAEELGLECDPVRIDSADDIPGALRALTGRTGAIWLPLDPALLTSENFGILNEYSRGNALPLYVSTEKLVRSGAPAGFSVSFANMGRTAGLAANGLAAGRDAAMFQYPEKMEIFIDLDALGSIDRRIADNALREGAQVLTGTKP